MEGWALADQQLAASGSVSDSGSEWQNCAASSELDVSTLDRDPLTSEVGQATTLQQLDAHFEQLTDQPCDEGKWLAVMKQQVLILGQLSNNPEWQPELAEMESWKKRLCADLPDPARFQAGRLRAHVPVLEEYFRLTGGAASPTAKQVVKWLKEGIKFPFVDINDPGQLLAPKRKQKMLIVRSMLQSALLGGEDIEAYLSGDHPRTVRFPNHKSVSTYDGFVSQEVASILEKGVIREWAGLEPPVVTNGLLVVDDRAPKLRLCINPMYPNLFLSLIHI